MDLQGMSKIVILELITVFSLFAFTISEWVRIRWMRNGLENRGEIVWELRGRRVGTYRETFGRKWYGEKKLKDSIGLCEERYLLGNRIWDDIYMDTTGQRTKIYLNVQKSRIYLTILKGRILYRGNYYMANERNRIEVVDMTNIILDDLELEIRRKERGER